MTSVTQQTSWQKKVETLSTFEKRSNSLTNHIAKIWYVRWYKLIWYHSNKHMQIKITHTANYSQYELDKYSGAPWKQHSLLKSNITLRETLRSVVITQSTKNTGWQLILLATSTRNASTYNTRNICISRSRWEGGSAAKTLL